MNQYGFLQAIVFFTIVLLLVKPLGFYIAQIYEGKDGRLVKVLKPIELMIYGICSVDPKIEMNWKEYARSLLLFSFLGTFLVYIVERSQEWLPLNPEKLIAVAPDLAFNTAVSFVTNSDWQAYSGESTMSYFTQMASLTVQNFTSAAAGISVLMALIRGIIRRETTQLGNFWSDMVRGILYILLPLSMILGMLLISQGVIQNFNGYQKINLLQQSDLQDYTLKTNTKKLDQKNSESVQIIPMGPVASQVAIKQLGTNGGGYFNANSAHPFENPTPFSNFVEMLAILLIPASLCYTFGIMAGNTRQGWALLIAMFTIYIPLSFSTIYLEQKENFSTHTIQDHLVDSQGGNMEGKETRFGILNSSLWAVATTATGNGSVNATMDSMNPLSGLISLALIDFGEIIFGGVGSGLYQMLIFVILAVFIAGLMVGRTPEYLGKKIEAYEMKMVSFAIIVMPITVLTCTAIAAIADLGKTSILNPGAHGFTEILYAFSSMTNNNGSAFAGLNANTNFYNILGGFAILVGRFWIAIPVLAIAGSLAQKKATPVSPGTLPTDSSWFILILVGIILIMGALTFLPAFALGPIAEQLSTIAK